MKPPPWQPASQNKQAWRILRSKDLTEALQISNEDLETDIPELRSEWQELTDELEELRAQKREKKHDFLMPILNNDRSAKQKLGRDDDFGMT